MFRSFFSLGIVDVGKVRGCSVSGICAYGFIQNLSMIWFQSTIVEGIGIPAGCDREINIENRYCGFGEIK